MFSTIRIDSGVSWKRRFLVMHSISSTHSSTLRRSVDRTMS
jgi:hypothetical protein